jgi:hypothetical protein
MKRTLRAYERNWNMKRTLIGLGLAFAMVLVVSGCSKLKVDCKKMCEKTFKECVGEVLVASGKMDQAKIDMIKKVGAFEKVQKAGYGACIKDCKKKKGFGSDAGEINKCLKKKNCKEYADCIKKHIK